MRMAALLIWLATTSTASAQEATQAQFNVAVLGAKVGVFQLVGALDRRRYTAAAQFDTTGLVGSLRNLRFTMKATGRRSQGHLRPTQYTEDIDAGRRSVMARLDYVGGVPVLSGEKLGSDNSPYLDPETQRDTIDPLSALFLVMRDQPAADICTLNQAMFDGVRRTQITMETDSRRADFVSCTATFRRLAGYTAEQLDAGRAVDISLRYRIRGDLAELQAVRFGSAYGPVTLNRR